MTTVPRHPLLPAPLTRTTTVVILRSESLGFVGFDLVPPGDDLRSIHSADGNTVTWLRDVAVKTFSR